jgi:polar amino acid transport system substrate-binding protein
MKLISNILIFLCLIPSICRGNEVVRLTNGEWAPYLSEHLPYNGVASHIVSQAFAAVDIDVEYDFFPWKRAFLYAKEGQGASGEIWNGSLLWIYLPDRTEHFIYSDPVVVDSQILFYLKDNGLNWQSLDDLKGKVLGGTAHTAYPRLEQGVQRGLFTINRGAGYEDLFKRLFANRIDAIPNVKEVGEFYIRTSLTPTQQSQMASSPTVIEKRTYYLVLSKKIQENKVLMERFNRGLKIIKDNGFYEQAFNNLRNGKYDPQ